MIINKIILKNFGIFFGIHQIDTKPQKNKPVILFGALNGSGKTTLLEGIQIALYGKSAQIDFRGKKNYYEYLKSLINNQANPKEGASIELEFEFNMNSKNEIFNLKRSWYLANERIEENSIIHNKNVLNGEKKDNVNEFIEDLMPSNISNLFFFDGEKIEEYADIENSKKIFKKSIKKLLGLDIVDLLSSHINQMLAENTDDGGENGDNLNTEIEIIIGFIAELNWATRIRKINKTAIKSALLRKAISSACFSCSPVKLTSTPFGTSYFSISTLILSFTSVGL